MHPQAPQAPTPVPTPDAPALRTTVPREIEARVADWARRLAERGHPPAREEIRARLTMLTMKAHAAAAAAASPSSSSPVPFISSSTRPPAEPTLRRPRSSEDALPEVKRAKVGGRAPLSVRDIQAGPFPRTNATLTRDASASSGKGKGKDISGAWTDALDSANVDGGELVYPDSDGDEDF